MPVRSTRAQPVFRGMFSISLACSIACSLGSPARAHAPPEINRIVWNQTQHSVALLTNRGLIFGGSDRAWQMLCGGAFSMAEVEPADAVYLSDGRLLVATSQGLRIARDPCQWDRLTPFMNTVTSALARHPTLPNTIYAGVSSGGRAGIHVSQDGAATWKQTLMLPDDAAVSRILIASASGARVYATAFVPSAKSGPHLLLRSSDAADMWEELSVPLRADESRAMLVAVSPKDPGILLVLASNSQPETNPDRLLVSRDAGRTFSELWSSIGLRDATFDADGQRVWIAGLDGLWRTDENLGQVMGLENPQLMTSVTTHAGAVYACGHHSGFDPVGAGVGVSMDGGATFRRWMAFTEVEQQVTCAAASDALQACREPWVDWQLEILVSLGGAPISIVDAGPAAATSGAGSGVTTGNAGSGGAPVPQVAKPDSGCQVRRSASGDLSQVAWTVALVAMGYRVRRSRLGRTP